MNHLGEMDPQLEYELQEDLDEHDPSKRLRMDDYLQHDPDQDQGEWADHQYLEEDQQLPAEDVTIIPSEPAPQPIKLTATGKPSKMVRPPPCDYVSLVAPYDVCGKQINRSYDVNRHKLVHVNEEKKLLEKGEIEWKDCKAMHDLKLPEPGREEEEEEGVYEEEAEGSGIKTKKRKRKLGEEYLCATCSKGYFRRDALLRHCRKLNHVYSDTVEIGSSSKTSMSNDYEAGGSHLDGVYDDPHHHHHHTDGLLGDTVDESGEPLPHHDGLEHEHDGYSHELYSFPEYTNGGGSSAIHHHDVLGLPEGDEFLLQIDPNLLPDQQHLVGGDYQFHLGGDDASGNRSFTSNVLSYSVEESQ